MALPWALVALSLLPLLTAEDPTCPYQKAVPITDAILERLSGKWFYVAGVFRNPELQRLIRDVKATFFYLTPNLKEDTIQLRDYETIGDECHYSVNSRDVQRQNGTLSRTVQDGVQIVHLWLSKDPKAFILLFEPEDEQNRGLAFYARKQKVTKKQLREFQEALKCLGLQDDEILYTDGKKDLCRPLDKQHKKERKKGNVES